jgi:hypothetical protein
MAREDQFVDDVEETEVSDGLGTSLIVVTTLVLIVAFLLVEMALKGYGRGMLAG